VKRIAITATVLAVVLVGPTGCSGSGSASGVMGSLDAALPNITGGWTGTWVDARYGKSGALSATFDLADGGTTGVGTIDLSSLGLGKQSGAMTGWLAGRNILTFNFSSEAVGNGGGTIIGTRALGSGSVTGSLNLGAFDFSGAAFDTQINGIFQFRSTTGGSGTVTMTKM
jgi:hypothetical protein